MTERDTKPIHIRAVPTEVVDTLQARASKRGMSLTSYLRDHLVDLADRPTAEEWVSSAVDRGWGVDSATLQQVVREAREEEREL
ncbi:hypothetical protein ACFFSW_29730 [Saccharothrix longispora]|uniref:Ribbon-helix-helix CopG family protein n=1 Tax=Saccharothrix longispora TaxID=33920 RepID=A0ABU1PWL5_9PSEU|nr:hypothetical protein [Saccharothrix longispora]MDR6595043.1 hypothetical protein [Saccharothrix longispora]